MLRRNRVIRILATMVVVTLCTVSVAGMVSFWRGLQIWAQTGPDVAPTSLNGILIERGGYCFFATRQVDLAHERGMSQWRWAHRSAEDYPIIPSFGRPQPFLERLGVQVRNKRRALSGVVILEWSLTIPLWLVVLPTMLSMLLIVRSWRHHLLRARADAVLCARCGYDLRATPARCPECGKTTGDLLSVDG
jgi:hypothetical protein